MLAPGRRSYVMAQFLMICVYRDNQFDKCLDHLKRAGGRAALAAQRAEALIAELALSDGRTTPETCRLTRNGEARIRKCRKYDLGDGYRLICIRRGYHLVLLYAGSHDNSDRWLERNRGLTPAIAEVEAASPGAGRHDHAQTAVGGEPEPDDELPADSKIAESDLRILFRGFWDR